jgi:hypothetical protein
MVLIWLGFLLLPALAHGQTQAAPAGLEPPVALTATTIAEPPDAPPHAEPIVVRVKLLVGVDGSVKKVELLTHSLAVFDDAVVRAVQAFRFAPGKYLGKPVQVEITFTHTFLPPPPPPAPPPQGGPPLVASLHGKLVEKGTRAPVSGATVAVQVGEHHYTAEADARGRFKLPLPQGDAKVTVHAAGYLAFLQVEHLGSGQELAVAYYVERERYDPYEILVFGEQRREELSRITLRGPELKQVPGTFGDPFRVVQTLPGVASLMSLLPFPVVRGASPGSTGYLIDGTRVPLLYHLLAGPSVIHPEFIDEVQFYPGGAPVLYGGYTAGIIDGRTRRARKDEHLIDVDMNLLQAGGLVRQPIEAIGATATAAARVGYPGLILSLATDQASLSYWDYQFRIDGGNPRNGWTLFAFGARDEVDAPAPGSDPNAVKPTLVPTLVLGFHRLDLRAYHGSGGLEGTYRLVGGIDQTTGNGTAISDLILEPSARWRYKSSPTLDLVAGLEGNVHSVSLDTGAATTGGGGVNLTSITAGLGTRYVASALTEALWRPTPRWLVRPGVRADLYSDKTATKPAADPRLAVRYRLNSAGLPGDSTATADDRSIWLKAGVGVYHQPARIFLPLPGLDTLPLSYGLLRAVQSSVGVEMPLATGIGLNLEAFYNDMNPVVFDLSTNVSSLTTAAQQSGFNANTTPTDSQQQVLLDKLLVPQVGRAYGLEALLRRQSRTGLYGWISYTLSLSERKRDGAWVPYDYDKTHLLNLVAGLPLPRNWDIGGRLQYQSGRPTTTTYGYNTARTDGYFRVDVRIDKRAVWNKWLLDFYVDLTNVALFPEEITPGTTIRYVLPTLGVRGRL